MLQPASAVGNIKQIDESTTAFTTVPVGELGEGTYEVRIGGDGSVRWGTFTVVAAGSEDSRTLQLGDCDGKEGITSNDSVAVLKHAAGIEYLTGDNLITGDCDGKEGITSNDSVAVLKHAAGLEYLDTITVNN